MALLGWLFIGWLFRPSLPESQIDSYIAGLILLAAAPCTAMMFVWSRQRLPRPSSSACPARSGATTSARPTCTIGTVRNGAAPGLRESRQPGRGLRREDARGA